LASSLFFWGGGINLLPPSDAVRKQQFIFEDLFKALSQFKKYYPPGNLKFNNSGIFHSLKLRILVEKIFPISLKLNFTPKFFGLLWVKFC